VTGKDTTGDPARHRDGVPRPGSPTACWWCARAAADARSWSRDLISPRPGTPRNCCTSHAGWRAPGAGPSPTGSRDAGQRPDRCGAGRHRGPLLRGACRRPRGLCRRAVARAGRAVADEGDVRAAAGLDEDLRTPRRDPDRPEDAAGPGRAYGPHRPLRRRPRTRRPPTAVREALLPGRSLLATGTGGQDQRSRTKALCPIGPLMGHHGQEGHRRGKSVHPWSREAS
jgi:hypothetical protein